MSVTTRPYRRGGWQVDIRLTLPNDSEHRERRKAPGAKQKRGAAMGRSTSASVVLRAHAPTAGRQATEGVPTLQEFWPRFMDGYP